MRNFLIPTWLFASIGALLVPQSTEANYQRRSRSNMQYSMPMYMQSYQSPYMNRPTSPALRIGAYDDHFGPEQVTVLPGTTVQWYNYGTHAHTITSTDGLWDSGSVAPGDSYRVTFTQPGVYRYYCRVHGTEMRGVVIVGTGIPASSGRRNGSSGY